MNLDEAMSRLEFFAEPTTVSARLTARDVEAIRVVLAENERLRAEASYQCAAEWRDKCERLLAEIRRGAVCRNFGMGTPWQCIFCESRWQDGEEHHRDGCVVAEKGGNDAD